MDKHEEGREADADHEPAMPRSLESIAGPEPFTPIIEGVWNIVDSTVSEIGDILSPEEARRRELHGVIKNRGRGRER